MYFQNLNWFAIFTASIVSFISGAIWFGPKTFYPVWWKALGKEPVENPGGSSSMVLVFVSTYVGQLLQVTTLAVVLAAFRVSVSGFSAVDGLLIGLLVGFGIGAAGSLSHRLFGGQGFRVWLIEVSNDVLNLGLAGLILASWV
jgi:hypothetical protein